MNSSHIGLKTLVLIGGGHAHVHVIKMLGMNPIPGIDVKLISRDIETPYSGMLPGFVAGDYSREECHIDLGRLCSFSRVHLIHAEVCRIDTVEKMIICSDQRPAIHYDVMSLDIGITPTSLMHSLPYKPPNIIPVKPIDGFAQRWEVILNRVLETELTRPINVAIVGGGGGGIELCFAIHHRFGVELKKRGIDLNTIKITVYTRGDCIMSGHNRNVQSIINRLMSEKGIDIVFNAEIVNVIESGNELVGGKGAKPLQLESADGRYFDFDEAIWCTQAMGQSWLKETGLECTHDGFVCVKDTLQSTTCPDVFACGDVAHLVQNPRPKAGVFAVRAGPPLLNNLRLRLLRQPLVPWIPQDQFLGIIGTGGRYAVASKGPLAIEGPYLWELKDRIDRVWMSGYQELPDLEKMMAEKEKQLSIESKDSAQLQMQSFHEMARTMGPSAIELLSKAKMRCGGCGSKVGAQVLQRALQKVKSFSFTSSRVITGAGDDAAIVLAPKAAVDGSDVYQVHTIDYFRSFISDPYIFGQIAANHSLSDVFAMNADPVTALALCVIPYGPEDKVEETLVHILAGAMVVLKNEGCSLVGGHTSEGSELALGFSVNGEVHPKQVLPKGPLTVGHKIILTKPLGTGTILAADMRGKAKGRWVREIIKSMIQSNRAAAKILFDHSCSACTDVTGFGLLGHLIEMIEYSNSNSLNNSDVDTAAKIELSSVPVFLGAEECVNNGIMSSLHPQNIRCARAVHNVQLGSGSNRYPLLFDPQTSGGLLATVPDSNVSSVLKALKAAGYEHAAVIGCVISREVIDGDDAYSVLLSQ